ncbi:MAG: hypothetical protein ACOYJF_01550 [Prevotella sp.]|jgi:hypothetical protein
MGLLKPSSKPRRFHLELPSRDVRRIRLRELSEGKQNRERRINFQTEHRRKHNGVLWASNGFLLLLIVVLLAIGWFLIHS